MDIDQEIKRRHAIQQAAKARWLENSLNSLAEEYGMKKTTLQDAMNGRPCHKLSEEKIQEAARRYQYGKEQNAIMLKHSKSAICKDLGIGYRRYQKAISGTCQSDPVRKFLTMMLVA